MNQSDQLAHIAKKLMWWQEPSEALARRARFIMQVMVLGTWRDVQTVRQAFGLEAFRQALQEAEPGIFDKRSWAYWHAVFGMTEGELPRRSLKLQ